MKVILKEEVASLGKIGEVVQVKNGYARNYLIPNSLAIVATTSNQRALEHHKRVLERKRIKVLDGLKAKKKALEKFTLKVQKQVGENGKIFGSVTTSELANQLETLGENISRKWIHFPQEIKMIGSYKFEVKLSNEVSAEIKLEVLAAETEKTEE
jgi:large subunit ribosomal protein L9